jgi:hypothetical protein
VKVREFDPLYAGNVSGMTVGHGWGFDIEYEWSDAAIAAQILAQLGDKKSLKTIKKAAKEAEGTELEVLESAIELLSSLKKDK